MYHGNEPYIFISYAHLDNDIVLPLIEGLENNGFRVWYDNGIAPGSEWPEYIAEKILSCSVMLVLLSENSLDSQNCKREINFALDEKKDLLVVHLEQTNMTPGMKLQLNTLQAVHKYKYPDNDSFINGLYKAKILQRCKQENKTAIEKPEEPKVTEMTAEYKKTEESEKTIKPVITVTKEENIPLVASEENTYENLFSTDCDANEKTVLLQHFTYILQQHISNVKKSDEAEKISENKNSVNTKQINGTTVITREHILKAVEFANKNKGDVYGSFETGIKITEKQLTNATSRFAKGAGISQAVAFLDTTIFYSGKNGFYVTKTALYSSYNPNFAPLVFSEMQSLELTDKNHIRISFKDGSKKVFYFSIYATIIFNLLSMIIGN